jgi:D-aspartate ligase
VTKVFILKGVPAPFHHGALAVCRTLGRRGVEIAANDEGAFAPGAFSRYRTEREIWDPWPADAPEVVDRLLHWAERQRDRALLIPVDDAAMMIVDDHQTELTTAFRFPAQPAGLVRRLSSKWEMAELATAHGLATARVERVESNEHLAELVASFGLPVVMKRIAGWSPDARGMPSVTLARTTEEAAALGEDGWDNLLVQEYIPGTSATSWMFNGYFDERSECLFGLTGYKIRQFPVNGGFTTLGRLANNDVLLEAAVEFFTSIGYVGVVDVGFRFDERDSSYKLLDVNPRVGSTFRLFVDADGNDVVRVCHDDLVAGRRQPRVRRAPSRTWEVEPHDLRVGLHLMRNRPASTPRLLLSAMAVDERAWWVADDPKPIFAAVLHGLRRKLRPSRNAGMTAVSDSGSASRVNGSPQDAVRSYFETNAPYWDEIYNGGDGIAGAVYRERLDRALSYVDALALPDGAHVVDVGAGAGVASVALARRGFDVVAVDVAAPMLELARKRAEHDGVQIGVVEADAGQLPFRDHSQDLVLALGLLPWIGDPSPVLAEFRRVLRPGGALVVSADNRWRFAELADPALSAIVAPLRRRAAAARRTALGRPEPAFEVRRHTITDLCELLAHDGFEVVSTSTVGYGPITFMRKAIFTGAAGSTLAQTLSKHNDSIVLRRLGVHVVASAIVPATTSVDSAKST